ncbi:PKD domain-containing protein [candidate division KSB1 bacterium]|nr:PKD domain-containing protein [candidate division KSB1 bacterium]
MKFRKWLLGCLLFHLIINPPSGWSQEWSAEIAIEQTGQPVTTTPDFDIDPNTGHLHIVTMVIPRGVLYTEMDKQGNIIRQEQIQVAYRDAASEGSVFGATVAVDPQGRPHVCYREPGNELFYSTYYTYWDGTNWSKPIALSTRTERGYMIRMDVSPDGKVHVARGSMAGNPGEELIGPVKYFRLFNGAVEMTLDNISRFRADDRLELDASYPNQVHLILGCTDYPAEGGPLSYWRSFNGGDNWEKSEIHSPNALYANGSPDLFVDAAGNVHMVYGSQVDRERQRKPSVRYARFTNNTKVIDLPVTDAGEVLYRYDTPQGIGSVAASQDGQIVLAFYSEQFDQRVFVRESHDGGNTWSARTMIASRSCTALGRNRQVIRALRDRFYAIYPVPNIGVRMRYKFFSVNHPPVANAGGPYTGVEGNALNFDASRTSDPDGNVTAYEWDFQNDGTWDKTTTTAQTSFTYPDDFTGQIKIRVTDAENETSTALATVTIRNVNPTVDAGGPYSGDIGATITFHGTATDPGADQLTYTWDLNNDGIFETPGQVVQYSYNQTGNRTVTLKVTDEDGGSGQDTAPVMIQTYPPVISQISNQTINEGGSFNPINLDDVVSDQDHADAQITWTFLGTQNLIVSQQGNLAQITPASPDWNGSETITFIARDPAQLADSARAVFTVLPVNDPPQVKPISITPISEGGTFGPINLDGFVTDPDHTPQEMVWSASGQQVLQVTINPATRVASVSVPDPDWNGQENITFTAVDQNGTGLAGSTTALFRVLPVNDAPVIHGNPGQTILSNEEFSPVLLDTLVTDIDNPVTSLRWTYAGNSALVLRIANRILTIQKQNTSWIGTEKVTFTVSDGLLSAQVTANFTVLYHNDPPQISGLVGETILENGHFQPINLNEKVTDPDHQSSTLSWSVEGYRYLRVDGLAQRLVQISVPDSEWAGRENLCFIVTDPGGLRDSVTVVFGVQPINDPPQMKSVPNFIFEEDSFLFYLPAQLKLWANDPDNAFEDLKFALIQTTYTQGQFNTDAKTLTITALSNWNGRESGALMVQDPAGASSSKPVQITVSARPDPPLVFDVVTPEIGHLFELTPSSIKFVWERAIDPDQNDAVYYSWKISRIPSLDIALQQYDALNDTFVTFQIPLDWKAGFYYWQVIAQDLSGHVKRNRANGVFIFQNSADVPPINVAQMPTEFALLPNHPNPFNPETQITYHLPHPCQVRLSVFNSLGQEIIRLVDATQPAGVHSTIWQGLNSQGEAVSGGIYIFKIEADDFMVARKMIRLP